MWINVLVVILELDIVVGVKYHKEVDRNAVQVDKSTGFQVFELHGFSVGVTSSIFIAAFLLLCSTYVAMRLGLSKVFRCCCHCQERMVESGLGSQHMQMMQQQQPQHVQMSSPVQPVQMLSPMQTQSRNISDDQSNSLDLPRVLTLKVTP